MKTVLTLLVTAALCGSALAAPSPIDAIRARLTAVEKSRFSEHGSAWTINQTRGPSGGRRFTAMRTAGVFGLPQDRVARGSYTLKNGRAIRIRVTSMGTVYR